MPKERKIPVAAYEMAAYGGEDATERENGNDAHVWTVAQS